MTVLIHRSQADTIMPYLWPWVWLYGDDHHRGSCDNFKLWIPPHKILVNKNGDVQATPMSTMVMSTMVTFKPPPGRPWCWVGLSSSSSTPRGTGCSTARHGTMFLSSSSPPPGGKSRWTKGKNNQISVFSYNLENKGVLAAELLDLKVVEVIAGGGGHLSLLLWADHRSVQEERLLQGHHYLQYHQQHHHQQQHNGHHYSHLHDHRSI